jgi:tetratricopeptide (TPR) repeat protein
MLPRFRLLALGIIILACPSGLFAQSTQTGQAPNPENDPQVIRDFELGRQLRHEGKLAEAAAAYQRVLEKAPNLAVAHLNLGLVRHDQHDYADSTKEFSRGASLDPNLRQAQLYLGIDAYLWGHYEMALKALQEAVKSQPNDPEALYWLGLSQADLGDLRGSAESLEEAAKLRPTDDDTFYQLDEVYLQLWKETYDRLVKANPNSFRIHQILAEGYTQSNRLDDARREYEMVLKVHPGVTGVHEALGDIDRDQKQLEAAAKEYRLELGLNSSNARVWYKLGDVLIDSGDFAGAAKAAQSAVALQPDFGPAYYVLGRLARQQHHQAQAIDDFEKALKLGVSSDLEEGAHYQLFRLLEAAGKTTEANLHKQAYLRLQQAREQQALSIAERERKLEQSSASH